MFPPSSLRCDGGTRSLPLVSDEAIQSAEGNHISVRSDAVPQSICIVYTRDLCCDSIRACPVTTDRIVSMRTEYVRVHEKKHSRHYTLLSALRYSKLTTTAVSTVKQDEKIVEKILKICTGTTYQAGTVKKNAPPNKYPVYSPMQGKPRLQHTRAR